MSDILLLEIDSLRAILSANKPIENQNEREALVDKMNKVKELATAADSDSFSIIKKGVEAMDKAVEAFLNQNKNKTRVDNEDEVLPENARPYQSLAFNEKKPLSIQAALKYFDQEDKAITKMPFKPKGGEVLLFKAISSKNMNDWRSNGYRWNQGNGGRVCLDGQIKRRVANLVTPTSGKKGIPDFQRISWSHRDHPMLTLVQFVGDETLSVDFPHKNSKKEIPYIRSAPSVLRDLEVSSSKPFKTYQDLVFNAPPDATSQNLLAPRNITQVRNAQQKFRKEKKGTDSLTNLVRLSLEYEDMRFLMVSPDIVMVSITPEMLKQIREILKIDYDTASVKQLLGYDTQFQLGDYYVS